MKRLIPIAVAAAIVAILISVRVRSRTSDAPSEHDGSWEPADAHDDR